MLRAAVEQFIDKEPQQIEDVAMSTLEGHQVNTAQRGFKREVGTQALAPTLTRPLLGTSIMPVKS